MPRKAKAPVTNANGLTSDQWIAAVGQVPLLDLPKLYRAWEAGECPTDWRKHYADIRAKQGR